VLVFLPVMLALPAMAELSGAVTEYGYYKVASEPERYRNIASTSGYVKEGGEVELVEQTQRVPLEKNRLFGFKFRISGFDDKKDAQLKLVVTHPEIVRPNGSKSTGYTYPILLEVKDGVIENQSGYSLDHDYELVEGDWVFEFWYYQQKLVSQTFTTYKSAESLNEAPSSVPADSTAPAEPAADQPAPVKESASNS
jgi:hypothetical protein